MNSMRLSAALAILLATTCNLPDLSAQQPSKAKTKKKPAARAGLTIPEVTRDKVICFSLYTVHDRILKLTAQLYPLGDDEDRTVRLQIDKDGQWTEVARTDVIPQGWTATFRVDPWDDTQDVRYRVAHGKSAYYEGLIRKNPVDKEEIVVAAFTGNSIHASHGGDIPRKDIIENVKKIDADLLFFSGDQVYDHNRHLAAWLKFGRDFGEIIKDRPTITIPDDHDVGQANLWGASGKKSNSGGGSDGGYFKSVEYVKEVERAQTSHLPDPFDARPIQRGIGVYFTGLTWGRISFAIIEDRKFKSGPKGLVPQHGPRPDHIRDPDYDRKSIDVPGAILLGERQLKFLDHWGQDWTAADMKVALSQTIFCGGAHIHGSAGGRLDADMDANGWPQTGRNKAVAALRKAFALHVAGDQHLATVFHHGIDEWNDAGYSFCVPSIANLYLRWWKPTEPGRNRKPGMPEILGEHVDPLGNKVTAWAVANPTDAPQNGDRLTVRAAGFGVVRLNKKTRDITLECWPRNVDVTDPTAKQYPGWPITISQMDNYGRQAKAYLPTLSVQGHTNPVVQVVDEADGSVVYTLRINGTTFRPKVFQEGSYTIHVGEGKQRKTIKGVKSLTAEEDQVLKIEL